MGQNQSRNCISRTVPEIKELIGRTKAPKTLAILADPVFAVDDERVKGKPPNTSNNLDLQDQESALKRSIRNINRDRIERLKDTRLEAQEILKLVSPRDSLQAFDFDANYTWATSNQLSQYRTSSIVLYRMKEM